MALGSLTGGNISQITADKVEILDRAQFNDGNVVQASLVDPRVGLYIHSKMRPMKFIHAGNTTKRLHSLQVHLNVLNKMCW